MKFKVLTTCFAGGGTGHYTQQGRLSPDEKNTENQVINLHPELSWEVFEGFGGAVTDAAAYVYSLMNEEQKKEVLSTYFSKEGLGYRLLRVPVDSCDFSLETYDSLVEKEPVKVAVQRAGKYIFPMLKDIFAVCEEQPEIMVSPWSPPEYMKTNGQRQRGGHLKREYYPDWAEYICQYILALQAEGFPVKRMSIQNEANAVQKWDSCLYSAEEEREFLKTALYPALKKHGLDKIEIYIWDHNKERLYERAVETIDSETEKMIAGMAFHWYSGDHFEEMELVRKRFPGLKLILSESCLEYCKFRSDDVTEGVFSLLHELIGDLNHGMSMFHDWNLCLDEEGGPNYVGNYCHAPCLFHKGKKRLLPQPTLDCFYHISHYLRPGSVRIAHSVYTDKIESVAYKNTDGSIILVLLNRTEKQLPVNLRLHGQTGTLNVLPQSVTTCTIEYE